MRTKQNTKKLYLESVFSKEDPILKKIRETSEKENVSYMQISSYEGGIIQFLCQALQVKKAVEIGTLYGYSSLMIARALSEEGELFTLDIDQKTQEKAKALIQEDPCSDKIHFISGPAIETLKTIENKGPFDMIFIDADKKTYLDYLKWSYKNLKTGGLVVADNTFLFGAVYGEAEKEQDKEALEVMKKFNEELAHSDQYISTLIPTAEGMTVGIKK